MKKIIWIDIGTHFAQEHSSIFGSNLTFFYHILKRLIGSNIFSRGKFVTLMELKKIFSSRIKIRKRRANFFSIFVEANSEIVFKKNNYLNADLIFNLALTNNVDLPFSITKLYLGDRNEFSQGSSLFLEKENVYKDSFVPTIGILSTDFFRELENYLTDKFEDYDVLLRINCEGMEDDVIYSAYNNFGKRLKFICGALKDVKSIKGIEAFEDLKSFMSEKDLKFEIFHSRIDSWLKPHLEILKLLKKD